MIWDWYLSSAFQGTAECVRYGRIGKSLSHEFALRDSNLIEICVYIL